MQTAKKKTTPDFARDLISLRKEVKHLRSVLERVELALSARPGQSSEKEYAPPERRLRLLIRTDGLVVEFGSAGTPITQREATLLDLMMNEDLPVPRSRILSAFYPNGERRNHKIVDVYVSRLRQKLRVLTGGLNVIDNIPDAGFLLRPDLCGRAKNVPAVWSHSRAKNEAPTDVFCTDGLTRAEEVAGIMRGNLEEVELTAMTSSSTADRVS